MKRLTTDNPTNMTENLLNLAYAQDGWVHIRDMEANFLQYTKQQCQKHGCDLSEMSDYELCESVTECGFSNPECPVFLLYVVATQAAELRARLKQYEDAEVKQPCIEGLCPDHVTLAEQQANLACETDLLREVMELLGLAVESLESIADCETCKHFDDCSYDHEYRTAMAGNVRIPCTDCFSWKHTDRLDALTKRER